jgi:hypothetical protein
MPDASAVSHTASFVEAFRQRLIHAGFRHANAVGELVSDDNRTWVTTGFAGGEYRIAAFRRPRTYGNPERMVHFRVHAGTDSESMDVFGKALAEWGERSKPEEEWDEISELAAEHGPIR